MGASAAFQLVRAGAYVTLLEKGHVASGLSAPLGSRRRNPSQPRLRSPRTGERGYPERAFGRFFVPG